MGDLACKFSGLPGSVSPKPSASSRAHDFAEALDAAERRDSDLFPAPLARALRSFRRRLLRWLRLRHRPVAGGGRVSRDIADLVGEALVCDVDAEAIVLFADAMTASPRTSSPY
ncbi:hypothetical protein [Terrabacter sp. BE26]|uniref:hypothetical protein n=1 Tax=Terrabacter sp. BE26 TaxID=2898152 RepID=UPI0035BE1FBD